MGHRVGFVKRASLYKPQRIRLLPWFYPLRLRNGPNRWAPEMIGLGVLWHLWKWMARLW